MPDTVREEAGHAIYLAQLAIRPLTLCPWLAFGGAKVLEAIIDDDGDTFRAVYTVNFKNAVYTLHVFQKIAKKGIATDNMNSSKSNDA
jgi:phage-related protein